VAGSDKDVATTHVGGVLRDPGGGGVPSIHSVA